MNKVEAIKNITIKGVDEVIDRDHLEGELLSGKKLRVKFGIDPTSPDLHLGHAVVLRKLKEFENLGHKIVLIIGDFTAQIGDPSGRSETRKPLNATEIKKNMKKYLAQAGKVIDIKKAEILWNGKWFAKEGIAKMIELSSATSIQQVLRRADFKKRLDEGNDISLLEALYPVLQGYDSVKVKSDVEIGGTDQKFNLLMGRRIQRHFFMKEQDIITIPLLEGTDGERKMSKSFGNYISLDEDPDEMFGKIMSVPDKLVHKYFALCTDVSETDISKLEKELKPRDLKVRLGFEIVKLYH
ncbi:MAG: tyrosine--tRNA ligase, partial [Candidatus Liptonbacteria bacterium]|nr:tyrosine--tRNA ligase [Candidatus Liptonbacteria bacterium]